MPTKKKVTNKKLESKSGLPVPIFSLAGKSFGEIVLPKEVFGKEVNHKLLAQALRVYLTNQKTHSGNTKTRSEVEGSTRKISRQKGTGRARHGGIRAPIFVGGGIALGPKSRKTILELPKKMKKAALISALSQKAQSSEVLAISDLNKATGKTSQLIQFLNKTAKKSALFIADSNLALASRAVKNLPNSAFTSVDQLNVLEILKYQTLIFSREAVDKIYSHLFKSIVKKTDETMQKSTKITRRVAK